MIFPYFRNQFRGDLIIIPGVIYYFPHTNVAGEKLTKKDRPTDHLSFITHIFGSVGLAVNALAPLLFDMSVSLQRFLSKSINQPKLRESGLWKGAEISSQSLQSRLDAHIAELKQRPPQLLRYEYALPKPMRFAAEEIRNISVKYGKLSFNTEYDRHDFRIGFRRQRLLGDALWEAGLIHPQVMPNNSLNRSGTSSRTTSDNRAWP